MPHIPAEPHKRWGHRANAALYTYLRLHSMMGTGSAPISGKLTTYRARVYMYMAQA